MYNRNNQSAWIKKTRWTAGSQNKLTCMCNARQTCTWKFNFCDTWLVLRVFQDIMSMICNLKKTSWQWRTLYFAIGNTVDTAIRYYGRQEMIIWISNKWQVWQERHDLKVNTITLPGCIWNKQAIKQMRYASYSYPRKNRNYYSEQWHKTKVVEPLYHTISLVCWRASRFDRGRGIYMDNHHMN